MADLGRSLRRWPVWWTLTWHTIRGQYRRTYLGPWWMTVQMDIFVLGLTLLFGILLRQDIRQFLPYVAFGYIGFMWMTGMVQAGADSILGNASAIKTTPGSLSIYALQGFAGTVIQLGHDALIIVLVIVALQVPVGASLVVLPLSLVVVAINGIAVALWLGPLVARYRDVGEVVTSVLRVLFFFTPVFWVAGDVSRGQLAWLTGWNPLSYLLEIMRAPLLGQWPSTLSVVGAVIVTVVNLSVAVIYFSRMRTRLAYWI